MNITETDERTLTGKPIVRLTINGIVNTYYREDDGSLQTYDETINDITSSVKDEREETKKLLLPLDDEHLLGLHEYTTKEGKHLKAFLIWTKKRGTWFMTVKRGLSDLDEHGIEMVKRGIREMNW